MLLFLIAWLLLVISLWLLAGGLGTTGVVYGWAGLLLDGLIWLNLH